MTCNTSHFSTWLFHQIMALKQLFDWAHYIFPNISARKALEIEPLSLYIYIYIGAPKGEPGKEKGRTPRGKSKKAFKMVHLPLFSEAPIVKP